MRTALVVALIVVASAAQIGCGLGGGSQAGDCDAGCLTPADDAFLTKFCTTVEACCVASVGNTTQPDVAACKRTFMMNGFSRDPALQSMCLSELQGLASAGAGACLPEISNLSAACSRVVYEPGGASGPGQQCTTRSDCAGEAGAITLCVAGFCLRMARGEAGDATCLGDVSDLGIIVAAPEFQAAPLPPITTGVLCERRAGLYCAVTPDPAQQACAPLRAGGVACDFSRTCASSRCYNGDNTQGTVTGTCTSLVPAGQPCGGSAPPATACDAASYCLTDITTLAGLCMPRLPGGSSCDADYLCVNETCTNGVCKSMTHAQDIAIFGYCSRVP
jgi:hypothetical protein